MKKLNFRSYIFLLLSPLLLGTSYAPMDFFYKVKNSKKIAFNGKLLKNVDYDSFQVFFPNDYFASDNKNIFFKRNTIPELNKKTFKAYSNYLGSDGTSTILWDHSAPHDYKKIHTNNFTQISNHYFYDKNSVYFLNVDSKAALLPLKSADSKSFKIIHEEKRDLNDPGLIVARDKNSVYLRDLVIFNSKTNFKVELLLKNPAFGAYLRINNSIFYVNRSSYKKVSMIAPKKLHFINDFFISDGQHLYKASNRVELKYKGSQKFPSSKLKVFERVWGTYKDSLYYLRNNNIKEFTNVDVKNFKILRNYCKRGIGCIDLAKDSNRYFYTQRAYSIKNPDPNIQYVLDKYPNHRSAVFFPGTQTHIKGADQKSFTVLKDWYSKDAKKFYYYDKPMPVIPDKNFEVLSEGFAKDAKAVYYKGIVLKKADPRSFKRVPGKFSDKSFSTKKIWKDAVNTYDHNGKLIKSAH